MTPESAGKTTLDPELSNFLNFNPPGLPPPTPYISPGKQLIPKLKHLPPARIFTCGFDCLHDFGAEFSSKLEDAGNQANWNHYETLCHGFLQMEYSYHGSSYKECETAGPANSSTIEALFGV